MKGAKPLMTPQRISETLFPNVNNYQPFCMPVPVRNLKTDKKVHYQIFLQLTAVDEMYHKSVSEPDLDVTLPTCQSPGQTICVLSVCVCVYMFAQVMKKNDAVDQLSVYVHICILCLNKICSHCNERNTGDGTMLTQPRFLHTFNYRGQMIQIEFFFFICFCFVKQCSVFHITCDLQNICKQTTPKSLLPIAGFLFSILLAQSTIIIQYVTKVEI